ncbi:MAG TPA: Gldg family protein, partial [Planctomycetota bacterium]|nr:Gldg family protein [Planctomycetota bacterium]
MITHVVKAVFKRDLRSWFGNPVGYVFIILFVLLCAAALVFSPTFFRQNLANLDTLDYWLPSILLVFIPAITMGMWASERSNGTQELLLTLPAKDSEILLGKYLAAAGVYTVALLFTLTLAIGLSLLGSPDWGQLFCNYLGMWFLGLLAISVAMLGSLLVDNLAVSFILGAVFAGVVIFSGDLLALVSPGTGWLRNGPHGQFLEFSRGVLPFGGVLLFAGMTVTFLYLNLALLSRRLWRLGDATGMHRSIRCAAMLVGAIALTAAGVYWLPRPDGTIERIHSLSGESTRLLAGLDKASPVFVTAYVSDDVPQELVQTKRTLLNLLDRFESMSGGAVQKRVVITEPYTEAATAAQNKYNIYPSAPSADSSYEAGVFLGFVVQCRGEEVVSPFVMPGMSVEYELSRSIRVAANANRRKVGVLKTEVELYGGFDFQTFQQKPRWLICDDLQLQYKVENVDADQEYPKDLDALLVPQPSSLSQEQLDKLKTWVLAGHPTLLLEDAEPMSAPGTAATDPKGGQQRNPMMGGQPPGQKGDIAAFFGAFGVNVSLHDLVWDSSFQSFTLGRVEPELLFVGPQGMNRSDPVTANLQKLVFLFSGQV